MGLFESGVLSTLPNPTSVPDNVTTPVFPATLFTGDAPEALEFVKYRLEDPSGNESVLVNEIPVFRALIDNVCVLLSKLRSIPLPPTTLVSNLASTDAPKSDISDIE